MKKSQLVSAIKTILAENKKQKLDENTIRQVIREVLAEKEDINEAVHGQSALHKLAKSSKSFQEFQQKAQAHLEKTSKSTLKTSGTVSSSMKRNLKSIWDERNDDDYDTAD
jgi:hypothetical protein